MPFHKNTLEIDTNTDKLYTKWNLIEMILFFRLSIAADNVGFSVGIDNWNKRPTKDNNQQRKQTRQKNKFFFLNIH